MTTKPRRTSARACRRRFDRGFERVKETLWSMLTAGFGEREIRVDVPDPARGIRALDDHHRHRLLTDSDAGILRSVRAPRGMRLEETEKMWPRSEDSIRQVTG